MSEDMISTDKLKDDGRCVYTESENPCTSEELEY